MSNAQNFKEVEPAWGLCALGISHLVLSLSDIGHLCGNSGFEKSVKGK